MNVRIPLEVADELYKIENAFLVRSKSARERARKAWNLGDKRSHAKMCAVARVWKMAAEKLGEFTCPF